MSVLGIDQKLRRSFNKLKSYGSDRDQNASEDPGDAGIYLQTFLHHWDSCHQTFVNHEPDSSQVQDDVINVTAQLEQMIELMKYEGSHCGSTSILDYILSENVLGELSGWTKSLPFSLTGPLINLQIRLFEFLIMDKERGISLLSHQTILRPLIALLELCETNQISFKEAELLGLIHSMSIVLIESPDLIELFLSSSQSKKLILFSLLTPYLHKSGQLGQRAKESILIFISMSSKHKIVESVIVESNFCLILATGLSALFSALPRDLEVDHPSWHKLEMSDCQTMPELSNMLASLELCSAVIEVSPGSISTQLLDLVLTGFLSPILGPAIMSETEAEIVSYTAYLNFFLNEITAEPLVVLIIRFLLTGNVDGKSIKDVLLQRISASSRVSIVTLALFETLLSFNIEDVMFCLIFKHLVPCTYLLPSYREEITMSDPQGRAAHKFLSLVPVSCDPPATPVTPRRTRVSPQSTPLSLTPSNSINNLGSRTSLSPGQSPRSLDPADLTYITENINYKDYTREVRQIVRRTALDCLEWNNQYDGRDLYNQPTKIRRSKPGIAAVRMEKRNFQLEKDPLEDTAALGESSNGPSSLSGDSSGYLSGNWEAETEEVTLSPEEEKEFWSAVGGSAEVNRRRLNAVLARIQHEDRLSLSSMGEESPGGSEDPSPRPSVNELPGPISGQPSGPISGQPSGPISGQPSGPISGQPSGPISGQPSGPISGQPSGPISGQPEDTGPRPNDAMAQRGEPLLGPFLTNLLEKVKTFDQNNLCYNLRLTAIISKLTTFPQPLLRSVLIHPDVVLQPTCITLIQAICTVRSRIDSIMPGLLGAEDAVRLAKQFLNSRIGNERDQGANNSITSLPATLGEYSRRGSRLFNLWGRKSNPLHTKTPMTIPPHTHKMAMAAVLLEEWLQELAAIAQEHALLEQQAAILR